MHKIDKPIYIFMTWLYEFSYEWSVNGFRADYFEEMEYGKYVTWISWLNFWKFH